MERDYNISEWAKGKRWFVEYSKSPTYERVLFQERIPKSNLFVSPTKLFSLLFPLLLLGAS